MSPEGPQYATWSLVSRKALSFQNLCIHGPKQGPSLCDHGYLRKQQGQMASEWGPLGARPVMDKVHGPGCGHRQMGGGNGTLPLSSGSLSQQNPHGEDRAGAGR